MANAAYVTGIEPVESCCVCKSFNENDQLSCGQTVLFTTVVGKGFDILPCHLKLVLGFVNNYKVSILRDSGSTLIGVKKDLPKIINGSKLHAELFEATKNGMSWVRIRPPYLSIRKKCEILPNPCTDLIICNINDVCECNDEATERWKIIYDNEKNEE